MLKQTAVLKEEIVREREKKKVRFYTFIHSEGI